MRIANVVISGVRQKHIASIKIGQLHVSFNIRNLLGLQSVTCFSACMNVISITLAGHDTNRRSLISKHMGMSWKSKFLISASC